MFTSCRSMIFTGGKGQHTDQNLFTIHNLWAILKVYMFDRTQERTHASLWRHLTGHSATLLPPVWLYSARKSVDLRWNLLLIYVPANNPSIFEIMRALMSEERDAFVSMTLVMGAGVCITLAAQTHDRRPVRKPKKCIRSGSDISSINGEKCW